MHNNNKWLFAFPGIGSALSMHEKLLYSKYASVYKPYFLEGSEAAGCDLADMLLRDRVTELSERQAQFFIYCFSVGTLHLCKQHQWQASSVAGYSFGVYAALYAAGVLSFSDCMSLFDKAYLLMAGCEHLDRTGMTAIIGLPLPEIQTIIKKQSLETLYHTNSNNEYCHIFCGDKTELALINKLAMEADAINAVFLEVSLPYHHPGFSRFVSRPLEIFCSSMRWHAPKIPLFSTIDYQPLYTPETIQTFVIDHLTTPINWHKTVERIYTDQYTHCIECGPGITLTQNARFIPGSVHWLNCKNLEARLTS